MRTVSTAYSGTPSARAEDLVADVGREPRHEPGEELLHRLRRQRLEVERGEAPLPGAPGRPALEQLGPREREDEDRRVARPVEEVLDEVEQALVGPLHVLEGEHRRIRLREALEEEPPGGEEILLVAGLVLGEAEEVRQPGLDEAPLLRRRGCLRQRRLELGLRRRGLLVLGDPAAHAHHVGQRPVGDALAVRQAAPPVPVDALGDAVEVLVELPREPRLPDAGDPGDGDEMGLPLLGRVVEELLDLAQLAVAADERRLQALRLERPAQAGDDPLRPEERRQPLLALQLEGAGLLVDDRLLGGAARRVADVDRVPARRRTGRGTPC